MTEIKDNYTTSIKAEYWTLQSPNGAVSSVDGAENAQLAGQLVLYDVVPSNAISTAGSPVLGLRFPGNSGDSEAVLILAELISRGLAKDNESNKAIAAGSQRSMQLDKIMQNIEDVNTLQGKSAALSAQRADLVAVQTSSSIDMDRMLAKQTELQSKISDLSGVVGSEAEVAAIQLELEQLSVDIGILRAQINNHSEQIAEIDSELATTTEDLKSAKSLEKELFVELQRLASDQKASAGRTESSANDQEYEDREQYRLNEYLRLHEEQTRDKLIEGQIVDSKIDEVSKGDTGPEISVLLYNMTEILRHEAEIGGHDPDVFGPPTQNGRLQFPL